MTEHVYNKFNCERFLELFKHYKERRDALDREEAESKRIAAEAAKKALQSKAYLPTKSFSGNFNSEKSITRENGYGIIESDIPESYNFNAANSTMSSSGNKKRRQSGGNSFYANNKKGKWSSSSPGGAKKKFGYKKKFSFKRKKK